MTSKILVADDSLTIQKVIGITLASSGYVLSESLNDVDLLKKIDSNSFDLVLLDFNLSDSKTGYELAKLIHNKNPNAAIIVMLGTFDTVDESQFLDCGISDKIVKPFESNKFIKKCRDLLEGNRPEFTTKSESNTSSEDTLNITNSAAGLDLWKVEAPKIQSQEVASIDEPNISNEIKLDPLNSEIEGWGFAPQVSLEEKFNKVFPPVIEEANGERIMDRLQTASQFIQTVEENDEDLDETNPTFEIPFDLKKNLIEQIEEEVSAEAFWAVDDVVPVKSDLDEVTADLTDKIQAFKNSIKEIEIDNIHFSKENVTHSEPIEFNQYHQNTLHNQDELVEKLKVALRPMIEEMIKEFCRQSAEKVAWEVIPDLAENLIRKEIKEISDSVKH